MKNTDLIGSRTASDGRLDHDQSARFIDYIKANDLLRPPGSHRVWHRGTRWTATIEVQGEDAARQLAAEWKRDKRGTVWWNKIGGR